MTSVVIDVGDNNVKVALGDHAAPAAPIKVPAGREMTARQMVADVTPQRRAGPTAPSASASPVR